jgi:tripartite-type tricarboxylate transporter receptor subunit TctC
MSVARLIDLRSIALTLSALLAVGQGWAQSYPAKPVRYLIPMSPGSGADTIGRIIAGGMSPALGQQVVIDNRTGAAGNIGAELAAKSPPDGYTVFQASMTHAVNATLYSNLPYDLVRDFAAVTLIATSPSMVVVHPSLPVKSVAELVRLAKARPGALNYASTGSGTATFLAGELFKTAAGVNLQHVPYRGGGEALIAVVTGEVSVYLGPLATVLPQVQHGKLRGLAVTTLQRLPVAPQYPTVAESGYPGYEAGNWYGLVVPAKTPREAIVTARRGRVGFEECGRGEAHGRPGLPRAGHRAGGVRGVHQGGDRETREDPAAGWREARIDRINPD